MEMFDSGKWIWLHNNDSENEYVEFIVEIGQCNVSTLCKLSCDGDYTLFINDQYVASNQYGDYEHYKIYDVIEISKFLTNKKNVLKILVWHFGKGTMRYIEAKAGLIFEILQDDKIIAQSNDKVLCRKNPMYCSGYQKEVTPQLGFSFLYDATKESDNEGYTPAVEIDKKCNFYHRPIKKLEVGAKVESKILKKEENYLLIDLGKETVGLPVLEFESSVKQKLRVDFGEDLQNGHVRRIIEQ